MKFEFSSAESPTAWLKMRPGCYVRIEDITAIGLGVKNAEDGEQIEGPTTVVVYMRNPSYATFPPCYSPEEAEAAADALVLALEANARLLRGL